MASTQGNRQPVLVNLENEQKSVIEGSDFTLGRSRSNNIVLDSDVYASGRHARIYFENGWWIEDLGSSNGTSVNQEVIAAPQQLSPGDVIKVGRTLFRIE